MKKILFILVLTFCMFTFNIGVKAADEFSCKYESSNFLWHLTLEYTVKDNDIDFQREPVLSSDNYVYTVMDFVMDEYKGMSNQEKRQALVKLMNKRCPKTVYICEGYSYENTGDQKQRYNMYAVLFDMQYQGEALQYKGKAYYYDFGDDLNKANDYNTVFLDGNNNCFNIELSESKNADEVDMLGEDCVFARKYLYGEADDESESLKYYYDSCQKNKNQKDCKKYNKNLNVLKTYCYSTIELTDYNNPCVKYCSDVVPNALGNIQSNIGNNNCHLSDKIVKFIANILKWVKYFAPVLVIILSLFDFVKALVAQNDEDMKKAQGKFVRRLIAAALLFLIPFLIYFTLDKFNLINSDPFCKII